jgi:DNA-binding PadR family transcriptional regulator
MSETGLLVLLAGSPRIAALARSVERPRLFPALQRLERNGYVMRRRDGYRLTSRGRRELEIQLALARTVARAF